MKYRIYTFYNYIFVHAVKNGVTLTKWFGTKKDTHFAQDFNDDNKIALFGFKSWSTTVAGGESLPPYIDIADFIDENDSTYEPLTLLTFLVTNTGQASDSSSSQPSSTTILAYKRISTASTNTAIVKASSAKIYSIVAIGLTSTVRYLKFYNKATTPVLATDVPVWTYPIPANTQGAGIAVTLPGVDFSQGLSIAITAGRADTDEVAVAAGDVIVNLAYS